MLSFIYCPLLSAARETWSQCEQTEREREAGERKKERRREGGTGSGEGRGGGGGGGRRIGGGEILSNGNG